MIMETASHKTAQGDIIYISKQNANYCIENNIILERAKTSNAHNQRLEIIALLQVLPSINTLEFRELGYLTPQPRIFELRTKFRIITRPIDIIDRVSVIHKRVGDYVFAGAIINDNAV